MLYLFTGKTILELNIFILYCYNILKGSSDYIISLYCIQTLYILIKRISSVNNFDDSYTAPNDGEHEFSSTGVYVHAETSISKCCNDTLGGIVSACIRLYRSLHMFLKLFGKIL